MKTTRTQWQAALTVASLAPALFAGAQVADVDGVHTLVAGPNRFRAGAQFLFNVKAEFTHKSAEPFFSGPNRLYDDGSWVNQDAAPFFSAANQTTDWHANTLPAGGNLTLSKAGSPVPNATITQREDPLYGFQIGYGRVLGTFDIAKTRVNIGLDLGFGTSFLNIKNTSLLTGVASINHVYSTAGLSYVPAVVPFDNQAYTGATGDPNPLPYTPTEVKNYATAAEFGKLDGTLYALHIGPFIELPVSRSLSMQARAGIAAMVADAKFSYTETIGAATTSGESSSSQWLFGVFLEAQLNYNLGKGFSVFAGGGIQHAGDTDFYAGPKAVRLKLDAAISATAGINYSF